MTDIDKKIPVKKVSMSAEDACDVLINGKTVKIKDLISGKNSKKEN